MPFFAVVMATRNRPELFRQALESVLTQSWQDTEIIVVNDGSDIDHQKEYQSLLSSPDVAKRVRRFDLEVLPRGHGQSFALNFGVEKATSPYLCFLDDDDFWIDGKHLERAQAVLAAPGPPVDLFMSDQVAFLNGERQPGPMWIADLPPILAEAGNRPDQHGSHTVTVEELLLSGGFCHLNTLIVRRALFERVGGMDENIRWECDHDLFLRLIDDATTMKYTPVTVSRHNVPNPSRAASMTTSLSEAERRFFQLAVYERARDRARQQAIREYAGRHAAYVQKRIAEALASEGHHREAAVYARKALLAGPTLKWAGYAAWRLLRAITAAGR